MSVLYQRPNGQPPNGPRPKSLRRVKPSRVVQALRIATLWGSSAAVTFAALTLWASFGAGRDEAGRTDVAAGGAGRVVSEAAPRDTAAPATMPSAIEIPLFLNEDATSAVPSAHGPTGTQALEERVREGERRRQATMDAAAAMGVELRRLEQALAERDRRIEQLTEHEQGLTRIVGHLEQRLATLHEQTRDAEGLIQNWTENRVAAVSALLTTVGVDSDLFLQRALRDGRTEAAAALTQAGETGSGGPLELFDDDTIALAAPTAGAPLVTDIDRMAAAQRLVSHLPLVAPLDYYSLTSGFGRRKDPLTGQVANHGGLDMIAAGGSEILATAPGIVTHAGPAGAYGNMVEIDHGLGFVTRYGHLKKVGVAAGDEVSFRQAIGVIGSTGRSTGRHLHYEVMIDGVRRDPSRFLEAGRQIVALFKS